MDDIKANTALAQANQLYTEAEEELARPRDHVVPYKVCRNSYKSVNKYLVGYLINHGMEVHGSMSLEFLLDQCRMLNAGFKSINLDAMYSTKEEEDVMMDTITMLHYFSLATMIRNIVNQN
jgi:hypothetical protein